MMNGGLNYSVTLDLTHPEAQEQKYLSILQKVIAVDREIDQINVRKVIEHTEQGLRIKIYARDAKLLRACVTGLMRHMRLVSSTIKQFKDEP